MVPFNKVLLVVKDAESLAVVLHQVALRPVLSLRCLLSSGLHLVPFDAMQCKAPGGSATYDLRPVVTLRCPVLLA